MNDPLRVELAQLRALVERQQQRISDLESRSGTHVEAGHSSDHTTRRALLAGAAAAISGAAVLASSSPAEAADLVLGSTANAATQPTGLAFMGTVGSQTYGLGATDHGLESFPQSAAVAGHTQGNFATGVLGYDAAPASDPAVGVWGISSNGIGVVGVSSNSATSRAAGVAGLGTRCGVLGQAGSNAVNSIGVFANASSIGYSNATALAVDGVLRAKRAGRTLVAAGTRSKTITYSPLTSTSLVLATAQNKLAGTIAVQTVIVKTTEPTSFTIWLTANAPAGGMPVAWFVVDTIGTALT
jgi:hypothetical protein